MPKVEKKTKFDLPWTADSVIDEQFRMAIEAAKELLGGPLGGAGWAVSGGRAKKEREEAMAEKILKTEFEVEKPFFYDGFWYVRSDIVGTSFRYVIPRNTEPRAYRTDDPPPKADPYLFAVFKFVHELTYQNRAKYLYRFDIELTAIANNKKSTHLL